MPSTPIGIDREDLGDRHTTRGPPASRNGSPVRASAPARRRAQAVVTISEPRWLPLPIGPRHSVLAIRCRWLRLRHAFQSGVVGPDGQRDRFRLPAAPRRASALATEDRSLLGGVTPCPIPAAPGPLRCATALLLCSMTERAGGGDPLVHMGGSGSAMRRRRMSASLRGAGRARGMRTLAKAGHPIGSEHLVAPLSLLLRLAKQHLADVVSRVEPRRLAYSRDDPTVRHARRDDSGSIIPTLWVWRRRVPGSSVQR